MTAPHHTVAFQLPPEESSRSSTAAAAPSVRAPAEVADGGVWEPLASRDTDQTVGPEAVHVSIPAAPSFYAAEAGVEQQGNDEDRSQGPELRRALTHQEAPLIQRRERTMEKSARSVASLGIDPDILDRLNQGKDSPAAAAAIARRSMATTAGGSGIARRSMLGHASNGARRGEVPGVSCHNQAPLVSTPDPLFLALQAARAGAAECSSPPRS